MVKVFCNLLTAHAAEEISFYCHSEKPELTCLLHAFKANAFKANQEWDYWVQWALARLCGPMDSSHLTVWHLCFWNSWLRLLLTNFTSAVYTQYLQVLCLGITAQCNALCWVTLSLLYTHCTLLHTHCTLLHTHSLSHACQIPAHLEGNGIFKLTDRNQKKDMNNLFVIFLSELDRFLGFGGIQKQRAWRNES